MQIWKIVYSYRQNIEHETSRAVLVNLPHRSNYDGYRVWLPAKLVRSGRHSYECSFSFTDSFKFKLRKFGKGRYNSREVIDKVEVSAEEFAEQFEGGGGRVERSDE